MPPNVLATPRSQTSDDQMNHLCSKFPRDEGRNVFFFGSKILLILHIL